MWGVKVLSLCRTHFASCPLTWGVTTFSFWLCTHGSGFFVHVFEAHPCRSVVLWSWILLQHMDIHHILSVHQLRDIEVVSGFWLLWIKYSRSIFAWHPRLVQKSCLMEPHLWRGERWGNLCAWVLLLVSLCDWVRERQVEVLPPETLTFPTLSVSHLCELMSCF